jgi:hypothetical protein
MTRGQPIKIWYRGFIFSLWRQSGFPKIRRSDDSEPRFTTYVEGLVGAIDHADRSGPLRDYDECVGSPACAACEPKEAVLKAFALKQGRSQTRDMPVLPRLEQGPQ